MYEVCGSTGEMLRCEWELLFNEKRAADIVQKLYYSTIPRRGGEYCCAYTETQLLLYLPNQLDKNQ